MGTEHLGPTIAQRPRERRRPLDIGKHQGDSPDRKLARRCHRPTIAPELPEAKQVQTVRPAHGRSLNSPKPKSSPATSSHRPLRLVGANVSSPRRALSRVMRVAPIRFRRDRPRCGDRAIRTRVRHAHLPEVQAVAARDRRPRSCIAVREQRPAGAPIHASRARPRACRAPAACSSLRSRTRASAGLGVRRPLRTSRKHAGFRANDARFFR
jgi:hypothetical protein